MGTTSTERYENYGDSTMVALHERFTDVLSGPVPQSTELMSVPGTAVTSMQEEL
jgi:hypothetical protein